MGARSIVIINWLALAVMLTMNILANGLPLNGYTTKQVSDLYPNLFVPAGFTFGIWGIIYLLLIAFVVYSSMQLWNEKTGIQIHALKRISPLFQISCILNAAWILSWHYLLPVLSVIIMLLLLLILIFLYLRLQPVYVSLNKTQQFLIYVPFVVYLGWISVATIANITAFFVFMQWDGFGVSPDTWAKIMIIIAGVLGAYFAWSRKDIPYTLVVIWALYGIYYTHKLHGESSVLTPLLVIGVLVLIIIYVLFARGRAAVK